MDPLESGPILIDQVYRRVLEAIAEGSLPPGQRIRQGELAEQLGVSRQPVSHALHLLKRQGLVTESGRKGFAVAPIDPARIRQLYEVRGALDGLAARLAAARADADRAGRLALEQALAEGEAQAPTAAVPVLVQLDTAFHQALYRLSGNPAFAEMVGPHWPQFRRSMATVLAGPDYRARAWAEHAAIVARVLQGDGEGAERAARDHALVAGRTTEERLGVVADAA
ncbi:GntR family transcriptional regulator [Roseomonas sp. NAR14]|uniref:GntR family transcriptional regulator n=1 Tax=Roseomonas acroporae TaxID=2937791 RepID=A0A9X2BXH8_9PROT|nr:GntR family transcriptional regulator [Roseomonas acroporae]MCK8784965.1 GntR family transcriptional regulator [Roseomonas acroporae]